MERGKGCSSALDQCNCRPHGVAWIVINHLKGNQIENLKARLELRDDEIEDYKRKLGGATPDEAGERLAALENEIAYLRPRSLSDQQTKKLTDRLNDKAGAVALLVDAAASDAVTYARGFERAFRTAGWVVRRTRVPWSNQIRPSGLIVYVGEKS